MYVPTPCRMRHRPGSTPGTPLSILGKENNMNNVIQKEIPEVKSLRWLANMFPYIEQPKDETDKMSNAIHTYCTAGAEKIEEMARERQDVQKYSVEYIKEVLRPLSNAGFDLWIYAMELRKKNINILAVEMSMVIKHLGIDKKTYYAAMKELAEKDLI